MLTDHRCTKYTDCSSCSFYQRDIFKYRLYPKGYVIPQTRCMPHLPPYLQGYVRRARLSMDAETQMPRHS